MGKEFLPRQQQAFRSWTKHFVEKVSADPEKYSVSEELAAEASAAFDAFNANFQRAVNPVTRTKPANSAKDDSRLELEQVIRVVANHIRADKTVTPAMRIELGMPERNSGGYNGRISAPQDAPQLTVIPAHGYDVDILLRDVESGRFKRPRGVHSAMIRSYVGENPTENLSAWCLEKMTTRCRFRITLTNADIVPGKPVSMCAQWFTARGKPGPIGSAITVWPNIGALTLRDTPKLAA